MNSWEVSTVEALRLGAEALRADAESAYSLGTLGDAEGANRDSAAARALEALAVAGANPESILAVAEGLRLIADAFMADPRFDELVRIEGTFRRLTKCDASPIASPEADEGREDRVLRLGAAADLQDLAACAADAVSLENFRTAATACGILARRVEASHLREDYEPWIDLTARERLELAEAIRDDWTTPDR